MSAVAIIGPQFYGFNPDTNERLAFGKVYTYASGTNVPKDTYTDETAEVANTNPVILNGAGYAGIYLSGSYKIVLTDANDNEIWTADPVTDPSQLDKEWIKEQAASQSSADTFIVSGDQTETFVVGRAVKLEDDVIKYGFVESATFSGGNTTVQIDLGSSITASLSRVWVGVVTPKSRPDSSTISITTSSGPQTLKEALNDRVFHVVSLTELKALTLENLVSGQVAKISKTGRAGNFEWVAGNKSAEVSSDTREGVWAAPSGDPTGASGAWSRITEGVNGHHLEWYGGGTSATGSDNRLAHEAATAKTDTVLMLGEANYTFDSAPTVASDKTTIIYGHSNLTGVTLSALNAIAIEGGAFGGLPLAAELRGKKIRIVCGSVRQSATDPTVWNWIEDANHQPVGFGSPSVNIDGHLVLPFDTTYGRVLSVVATPDENFARGLGFSVGASVGLESIVLKGSGKVQLSAVIRYTGSGNWAISYGTGGGTGDFNRAISSTSFSGSTLTINHDVIPGIEVSLTPWGVAGSVIPYIPYAKSYNNGSSEIVFIDPASGSPVSGANGNMAFIYNKKYHGEISFNSGSYDLEKGNIWIFGIMELS